MFDSIEICRKISDSLARPDEVQEISFSAGYQKKYNASHWHDWSFAHGTAGIAYLFSLLNEAFYQEGWAGVSERYLSISLGYLRERNIDQCGLFHGLTGLGVALSSLSGQEEKHHRLRERMEEHLIDSVEKDFLNRVNEYKQENTYLPPHFYNIQDGLSGILGYLLLRLDQPRLRTLTFDSLNALVNLFSQNKTREGIEVLPWYVPSHFFVAQGLGQMNPNGFYLPTYQLGIGGCLCALASAHLAGIRVEKASELINKIAYWLMSLRKKRTHYSGWAPVIPLEDVDRTDSEKTQDAFILRSLYLAGQALQDQTLIQFTEEAFLDLMKRSSEDTDWIGSSFSIGLAGFLGVSYLLCTDMKRFDLRKKLREQEWLLQKFYNPNKAFGFTPLLLDQLKHQESPNIPGFMSGSAGIVATLLLLQDRIDSKWFKPFLLA